MQSQPFTARADAAGNVTIPINLRLTTAWAVGAIFLGNGNQNTQWSLDLGAGVICQGLGIGSFVQLGNWDGRSQMIVTGTNCPPSSLQTAIVQYEFASDVSTGLSSVEWIQSPFVTGLGVPNSHVTLNLTGSVTPAVYSIIPAPGVGFSVYLFYMELAVRGLAPTGLLRLRVGTVTGSILYVMGNAANLTVTSDRFFQYGGLPLPDNNGLVGEATVAADGWNLGINYAIGPTVLGASLIAPGS